MVDQPENLILHLLREMRDTMATKVDLDTGLQDLRSDMSSLRADVAADLHRLDAKIDATRKDLSEQIVGLRRAVVEYHSSALGHGVLISELEDRVRRIETHLGFASQS